MKTVALIVAAGRGERFGGDIPKQFRLVHDRPLLSWTIQQFQQATLVDEIVPVVAEEFLLFANEQVVNPYSFTKVREIVRGGDTREESAFNGLKSLPISCGYVAIHDGARPIVDPVDIDRVIETAQRDRAAVLARPATDTVKRVEGDYILATLDRSKIYLAETPQVFQYDLIMSAHSKFKGSISVTDDAAMVEQLGFKVRTVIPERPNIKVTTEDDLKLVRGILAETFRTTF
ncbi:MAG: 2-C-methyl-D-erythritol 4-phosphate cytidylyltransferase [Candidatus Zixiibacteriota bacterium]|nr:MAG: 2-C-methyl-D-erythritol 4-phosphate cytidylyltransferase [candidate division Zixibacteria bacterium]